LSARPLSIHFNLFTEPYKYLCSQQCNTFDSLFCSRGFCCGCKDVICLMCLTPSFAEVNYVLLDVTKVCLTAVFTGFQLICVLYSPLTFASSKVLPLSSSELISTIYYLLNRTPLFAKLWTSYTSKGSAYHTTLKSENILIIHQKS
jgi:hypothetical protein